ncbi:amino acid ABC transporter permease [Streptosporangium sp. NPDC051022]|uniref:amino acid ABC transporter permease n=1 Tax=Streptosporangium sp. NPDC051022 TaxID=3155752 RepID=UPI003425822B
MADNATARKTSEPSAPPAPPPSRQDVVPVRHYGRGTLAVVAVAVVVLVAQRFATNPNIQWQIFGDYLFHPDILNGLLNTLEMTAIGMVCSMAGALVVALMRMSPSRVISSIAATYILFFRSIPPILLLIFVGNLGLFVDQITIGVPFTDLDLFSRPASEVLTPFVASILGLSLAGSGYMAEIVRAGLLAVGRGQRDAAKALGLGSLGTTRHIVLPQALRVIIPPMGNELISLLKVTAVVSVIGGGELLTVAQSISGANYRTIEMLLVAAAWYVAVITVLSIGQYFLERRIAER